MKSILVRLTLYISCLALFLSACQKQARSPEQPIAPGQANGWIRITTLPAEKISLVKTIDGTVYTAAASGLVYHSADSGKTWSAYNKIKNNVQVTAFIIFKHKIFVGSQADGVFMSPDNGNTWIATFPFPALAPASTFLVWNDHLYCSSSGLDGIYGYDENTVNWNRFNSDGLPTNYNLTVEKAIVVNNSLLTIQGVNGNFYTYDTGTAKWSEHSFFFNHIAGLHITDILYNNNTLYASYGPAIFRSDNTGQAWAYDTVGLKRANDFISPTRVMYTGNDSYYTLLNVRQSETWIQQRAKTAPLGTSWSNHQEHLSIGYSYDISQLGNKLFLATASGLYYKNATV